MDFKPVKVRLTFLYTGSLLFILIVFIVVLYVFISGAIKNQEIEQLNRFYESEEHDLIENIYEDKYDEIDKQEEKESEDDDENEVESSEHREEFKDHQEFVEYKPERDIFYYVFDQNHLMVKGEETVRNLAKYIYSESLHTQSSKFVKEVKWRNTHLLLMNYPLKDDEEVHGTVIIGMDITDEKHLINNIIWILISLTVLFSLLFAWAGNLFAGQAMKPIQKSFQTQRKFVSDASHELRTPLSIFYSSIDVLSREEKDHLSPFGRQILEDVKNESEMMNKLLGDLLFLARNDQGNFELDLEDIDLSVLLNSLVTRFTRIVPSNLALVEDIQDGIVFKGDKVRIQQLVYILLDNAIRYTKEGSVTCILKIVNQEIKLSIQDTGLGIPQEDIVHIFDRFYRGDSSRKRDGSGLGLAIAKTIVDAHSGRMTVNSVIDKGTEFTITFNKK